MKPYLLLVLVAWVGALHASRIVRDTPLNTGHFSANQDGEAFTKVNSDTDTKTGITQSGLQGILANAGKLRGAVDAINALGGMGRSSYAGDLHGLGGLWSDTKSKTGPKGHMAMSALHGYLNRKGDVAGSIGAGASKNKPSRM